MTKPTNSREGRPLRRGWTTGACATAATKSAMAALTGGGFEDPVTIGLPGGQTPGFALAHEHRGPGFAEAGIIKDAGDDPDVTHGALVIARVEPSLPGQGIVFRAGPGVGIVTRPGLPVAVGEAAVNPVPRRMMGEVIRAAALAAGLAPDVLVTISIPGGEALAQKTWNPRLGIVGGLSVLGTTGVVIPYSCSAWIHSIQSGIDVARAMGLDHVVGSTGDLSEKAAVARLGLPMEAYVDMGDFVGGMLKYLRSHPVARVTIAGGFAKMAKLGAGALDLHSARSQVDITRLAADLAEAGGSAGQCAAAKLAVSANAVLEIAGARAPALANLVARKARTAAQHIAGTGAATVHTLVVDRGGTIVGEDG